MKHKILYTSDVHGNKHQFSSLVNYAKEIAPDTIIIAGEIAPKNQPHASYIKHQRRFLEKEMPKLLRPIKENLPNANIFVSMGNDDCTINQDVLEGNEVFQHLKGRKKLTNDLDIVGYPYVPITPFGIKDLEKYDLSGPSNKQNRAYANRKRNNYQLQGLRSTSKGWREFIFTPEIEKEDSIQKDLQSNTYRENAENTIYVFHAPPNETNLDMLWDKNHVGSFAVRSFIESCQPHITLHGHIHETVDVSRNFRSLIGETVCMSAGNHNVEKNVQVLVFDAYNPKEAKRIKLSGRRLLRLFR